jgi:hypothetical protein
VKVKDKPTADALIAWHATVVAGLGLVMGLTHEPDDEDIHQVVYEAGLDLARAAAPDSPEILAEWVAAAQASQPDGDNMVPGESVFRFVRANEALLRACEEGVTT